MPEANKTFKFKVEATDPEKIVIVTVKSGEPGGDWGEFEEYMSQRLSEWFGGASVTYVAA